MTKEEYNDAVIEKVYDLMISWEKFFQITSPINQGTKNTTHETTGILVAIAPGEFFDSKGRPLKE